MRKCLGISCGSAAGRQLVFPNVELRLDVATAKCGFVNLHLFVSPEDPNHVEELRRLLSRLQFNVMQDRFDCTRADLIRLGKKADPTITDGRAALAMERTRSRSISSNCARCWAGADGRRRRPDLGGGRRARGTSGLREAADQTIRREIEGFADAIFARSSAQREFWLGQWILVPVKFEPGTEGSSPACTGVTRTSSTTLRRRSETGSPGSRHMEFDALRQACIDPGGRACRCRASRISHTVAGDLRSPGPDAPWMKTPVIPLNPGLVAIIGARGSGKTALSD